MRQAEPFVLQTAENGASYFSYDGWQQLARTGAAVPVVGFSARMGGASQEPFAQLNCALHVGDEAADVVANRRLLADALAIPFEAWTCAEQVHGRAVAVVEEAQIGAGRLARTNAIADTDGLLTNRPGVWLTSFYADCVPLFFYDPRCQAIAVAHAGWRGTAQTIVAATLAEMARAFGTQVQDVRALIGPAIGACCYEVDEQVATPMRHVLAASDDEALKASAERPGKYRLDLKRVNQRIMMKAGMLPEHIEISRWCTSCRTDFFFSHRKEHGRTGRMVAWIYLRAQVE